MLNVKVNTISWWVVLKKWCLFQNVVLGFRILERKRDHYINLFLYASQDRNQNLRRVRTLADVKGIKNYRDTSRWSNSLKIWQEDCTEKVERKIRKTLFVYYIKINCDCKLTVKGSILTYYRVRRIIFTTLIRLVVV